MSQGRVSLKFVVVLSVALSGCWYRGVYYDLNASSRDVGCHNSLVSLGVTSGLHALTRRCEFFIVPPFVLCSPLSGFYGHLSIRSRSEHPLVVQIEDYSFETAEAVERPKGTSLPIAIRVQGMDTTGPDEVKFRFPNNKGYVRVRLKGAVEAADEREEFDCVWFVSERDTSLVWTFPFRKIE